MRILHYTLGFSPIRTGGLIRYSSDLMEAQCLDGDDIYVLYPGRINLLSDKTSIKKKEDTHLKKYELVNSLPLALFGGIKTPNDFMKTISTEVYKNFLREIRPEVIHVHTLMGIHIEFFKSAKELDIPIIYTTHDYYGLFPEPTFFFKGSSYDEDNTVENWLKVSRTAMSTSKLRLFQTPFYKSIRWVMRRVRQRKKMSIEMKEKFSEASLDDSEKENFLELKKYYKSIFSLITAFHFNSSLAEIVFKKNIEVPALSQVISITKSDIKDKNIIIENILKPDGNKCKIGYIGPDKEYKGFEEFLKIVDLLPNNYEFHTYGYVPNENLEGIYQHGRFNNKNVREIFSNIDLLIVPSMWKETFGFIVLESLNYGTAVLVSTNVGSKDLLTESFRFENIDDIPLRLSKIENEKEIAKIKSITTHMLEIKNYYKRLKRVRD
ncbi:glycosyltransferase [Enterococcus sp. LJL120]